MLIWREGPSVNVDVGVDFYSRDVKATGLQNSPDTAGDDAFPNPWDHTSCDQNVFHCGVHRLQDKREQENGQHVKQHFGRSGLDPYLGPPLFNYRLIPLHNERSHEHRSEISTAHYSADMTLLRSRPCRAVKLAHVIVGATYTSYIRCSILLSQLSLETVCQAKKKNNNNIQPPAFFGSHFTIWRQLFFMLWFCLNY